MEVLNFTKVCNDLIKLESDCIVGLSFSDSRDR